jgi:hypothetical protein
MYPLRDAEAKERTSGMRLRACSDDDDARNLQADEPFSEFDDDDPVPVFEDVRARVVDHERETLAPPAAPDRPRSDAPRKSDPTEALSEVLFRAACGDREGSLVAAEELMARVPVVLMTKEDLRAEPLGYWELHMLAQIDAMSSLAELIDDATVPPAEVVRVVCELVERKIIALR